MAIYNSKWTGIEIDERLGRLDYAVNPNQLVNWYFGSPVNQRGQTEYTGKIYGIDGWFSSNSGGTISVVDDCVNLSNSGSNSFIRQKMEQNLIARCTYTFSVLVRGNIAGYFAVTQDDSAYSIVLNKSFSGDYQNWELFSFTFVSNGTEKAVAIRNNAGFQIDVLAAKLEFGDHQTLAHQENGAWVLNEIPNYGEELMKCQRYCYVLPNFYNYTVPIAFGSVTGASTIRFCLTTPVDLRATPTLQNDMTLKMHYNGVSYTPESVSVAAVRGNQVYLTVPNSESLAIQSPIVLVGYGQSGSVNEQKLILSADL